MCFGSHVAPLVNSNRVSQFFLPNQRICCMFVQSINQEFHHVLWKSCAISPSHGGDVTVYVWNKQTELAHPFFYSVLVSISVFMALSTVFCFINSLSNSPFSHSYLSGLISALSHLSAICIYMKISFSPDIIPSGWQGSKHQLTNKQTLANSNGVSQSKQALAQRL